MSLQRFFGISVLAMLLAAQAHAQSVFAVKNAKDATVKVFVSSYKDEADVLVYKTPFRKNAEGNKGQWFFTKTSGEADKRIFFTDRAAADLIVFFTPNSYEAGWKNKKKRYIMN